jgi:phosphoribosylanthranilate isomerase
MNTKIKICGLSRTEDIAAVNEAKPDYIGFVFAESRRKVSANEAAELKAELSPGITAVGVFVDAKVSEIVKLYEAGIIDIAQLHGAEDETYIEELRRETLAGGASLPIIKAFRIDTIVDTCKAVASSADYVLLDHGKGGTGKTFNWNLAAEFRSITDRPYFLAGGIDEKNIKDAIALHPYTIDVSSGAETDGVKDPEKIKNLVNVAHK